MSAVTGGGRGGGLVVALGAVLVAGAPLGDPGDRAAAPAADAERRFAIVSVGDSTVNLLTPREGWMRPGTYGIAVDPRQRDVLVARLRVLTRSADTSVALVTGQTTRMTTDFVAIFRRPNTPALRQRVFWGGLVTGLVAGASAALLALRGR